MAKSLVCMKTRSHLEISEAKCQFVCKTQNSRRVNCISSWGDSLALHYLLGLGRMTSPPDNIDDSHFWATTLLGSAWIKTLCIQRIPFLEASSISKNSGRELCFVVSVFIFQAIMLPWAFIGLRKNPQQTSPLFWHLIIWLHSSHLFRGGCKCLAQVQTDVTF